MLGVVATGHPCVSEAAASMLRAGGNAFDAALAAGFSAAAAEPMFTSLGGGGFLLARTSAGREVLIDFFTDTPGRGLPDEKLEPHFVPTTIHFPASEQVFNIGLGSVAVPGALAGFLHVRQEFGRLPLAQIVGPAVRIARGGVTLNPVQAYAIDLLTPINTLTAASRALFAPEDRTPRLGERLVNPDLASFLETLSDDPSDSLYGGAIARRIAEDMRAGGGLLTEQDLADYRVVERAPLEFSYRDRRVLTNSPPSFGGSLIGLSLTLLCDALPGSVAWGSAAHLCGLVAVMEEVDAMREQGLADAATRCPNAIRASAERVRRASGGTTHISVYDAEGNAVSMTLSNGEGSGYVVPGTGIMLNNMLGEDDLHPDGFHACPSGVRVSSMMSPSLVLREDHVELVLGSGGSKRIRTALMQVISAILDHDSDVRTAVEAPRLHWDGTCVQAEPGFEPSALDALERRWQVNRWEERNLYFGGVQAVDARGMGAGDPRRGGHAERVDAGEPSGHRVV